eukprot:5443239-Alexandrium_andersonii.AAC.1
MTTSTTIHYSPVLLLLPPVQPPRSPASANQPLANTTTPMPLRCRYPCHTSPHPLAKPPHHAPTPPPLQVSPR